ncbi:hypothetical protein AAEU31_12850 [Pseudoalteromonas sp. SSMSWG5]|uniref:hypothetical protein n=1 Tax=Pseudoalteromonas sp. SSMSWG5 TaxID=3139396 RepID=UPI003BA91873
MATKSSILSQLENPVISIADQYIAFKSCCKGDVAILDNDKTVQWTGYLQPTPLSRLYKVIIKYTLNKLPVCIVTEPDLKVLASGEAIPHTYQNNTSIKGTQLCLYLPKVKKLNKVSEWQPTMFVADTFIPWASAWLFYFECWLSTENWHGGGVEHDGSLEVLE